MIDRHWSPHRLESSTIFAQYSLMQVILYAFLIQLACTTLINLRASVSVIAKYRNSGTYKLCEPRKKLSTSVIRDKRKCDAATPAGIVCDISDDSCPSVERPNGKVVIPNGYSKDHVLSLNTVMGLFRRMNYRLPESQMAIQRKLNEKAELKKLKELVNDGQNLIWMPTTMNMETKNVIELESLFKKRAKDIVTTKCGSENVLKYLQRLLIEYEHLDCVMRTETYRTAYFQSAYLVKHWVMAHEWTAEQEKSLSAFIDKYFKNIFDKETNRLERMVSLLEKHVQDCLQYLRISLD
jgi:hypothetical protein